MVTPSNMDIFVAEVFTHQGPVELLVYLGTRIPDPHLRFHVALRYRLWDVAIAAVQDLEQGMWLLARLSKEADKNQAWIQKLVPMLKTLAK
jgi:uncharacterized membrane protein